MMIGTNRPPIRRLTHLSQAQSRADAKALKALGQESR